MPNFETVLAIPVDHHMNVEYSGCGSDLVIEAVTYRSTKDGTATWIEYQPTDDEEKELAEEAAQHSREDSREEW